MCTSGHTAVECQNGLQLAHAHPSKMSSYCPPPGFQVFQCSKRILICYFCKHIICVHVVVQGWRSGDNLRRLIPSFYHVVWFPWIKQNCQAWQQVPLTISWAQKSEFLMWNYLGFKWSLNESTPPTHTRMCIHIHTLLHEHTHTPVQNRN